MSFRNCLITLFNTKPDKIEALCRSDKTIFSFVIFQEELCPTTQKEHLQFYGELNKLTRLNAIKKFFNDKTIHIEKRLGSQTQAIEYCSKSDTRKSAPITVGLKKQQGQRNDIKGIIADVKEGKKLVDIIEDLENPNYQQIKCAMTLKSIFSHKRTIKPKVIWIYGSTGTGKTRYVFEKYSDIYVKDMTKWWDGYDQQETILVDDYRRDFCKFHELLTLTDRYPCRREFKGGSVQINSPNIIFTSPHSPLETWANRDDEDIEQLTRRIDKIIDINDLILRKENKIDLQFI